jgi:hypothetical protein
MRRNIRHAGRRQVRRRQWLHCVELSLGRQAECHPCETGAYAGRDERIGMAAVGTRSGACVRWQALKAMRADETLTPLGDHLASLPVDVRLAAARAHCRIVFP